MQDPNTMSHEDLIHEVQTLRSQAAHTHEALDAMGLPRDVDGATLTPYGRLDQLTKALVDESPARSLGLDVRLGSRFDFVGAYAVALAKLTKTRIRFTFNGIEMIVTDQDGSAQEVEDRYWAEHEASKRRGK